MEIPSDSHSWTDPTGPSGKVYYKVAALKSTPCYPTSLKSDLVFESAMSNLDDNGELNVQDSELQKISISPNPFSETTIIKFYNPNCQPYTLSILDITGKVYGIKSNE